MTTVFKQIEDWITGPPVPDGWSSIQLGQTLASITFALRPEVCVEIGVFGGRSLIPIALALKEIGRGYITGIDPWDPAASIIGQPKVDADWWNNKKLHDDTYSNFIKTTQRLSIQNIIKIERKRSDDVKPPENIGLLIIDGNHSEQAVTDMQRFCPKVKVGGFAYADDLNWSGGHVSRGVEWMKTVGFEQIYTIGGGAMLQRTSL